MLDCIAAGPGGFTGSVLLFARVGLCGGFTAFSAFSPEAFELLRAGHYGMARALRRAQRRALRPRRAAGAAAG